MTHKSTKWKSFRKPPNSFPLTHNPCGQWSKRHQGRAHYFGLLFLDQDAIPTLVEVKRSTNTDIRRKVVGQLLDYAANAVAYWLVEVLRPRSTAIPAGF
jgi:hypothetical protein